nr:MAG TPA: hypothetical protein [Caudoviricetes sp.]
MPFRPSLRFLILAALCAIISETMQRYKIL